MTLPLEHAVCWCILDLYEATLQSSVVLGTFYGYLQPLAQETIEKSGLFEKFSSDLQVSRGNMLMLEYLVDHDVSIPSSLLYISIQILMVLPTPLV